MAKRPNIVQPIDASLDEVAAALVAPATPIRRRIRRLSVNPPRQPATPDQGMLDLGIEVQRDIDGVEMGVLENGIPFLTQRGLAKVTGATRKEIFDITQQWEELYDDPIVNRGRISFLRDTLFKNGYNDRKLYILTEKDGSPHYAYPDIVCMAIIEYYAFEAQKVNETAKDNFRKLASYGLQKFIFDALHYVPPDKWKHFHDRVSILTDAAPDGYFIVFSEVSGLISDLIIAGLPVNDKTIPDISVGSTWGRYWTATDGDSQFGERIKYVHYYPSYYPQAKSNPQEPWAYPDVALPAFRHWFRHEYLPTKYPAYLLSKANVLGGPNQAAKIAALYQPKQIGM